MDSRRPGSCGWKRAANSLAHIDASAISAGEWGSGGSSSLNQPGPPECPFVRVDRHLCPDVGLLPRGFQTHPPLLRRADPRPAWKRLLSEKAPFVLADGTEIERPQAYWTPDVKVLPDGRTRGFWLLLLAIPVSRARHPVWIGLLSLSGLSRRRRILATPTIGRLLRKGSVSRREWRALAGAARDAFHALLFPPVPTQV
jgi:hypothetical protein